MNEKTLQQFEQEAEHIPTPEEVIEILRQMTGKDIVETTPFMDEQGNLCRLDAIIPGREADETLELYYARKGSSPSTGQILETKVHSVYMKDGIWTGTGPLATLVGEKWTITP